SCLSLVGDTEARALVGPDPLRFPRAFHHSLGLLPDLHRIVFHPSGLGIDLLVLEVIGRHDPAVVAEHHEARPRGALIDGCRVLLLRHPSPPYVVVVVARWGSAARLSLRARSIR